MQTIGMILDESFPPDPRVENEANLLIKAGYKIKLFCLGEKTQQETYNGIEVHRYKASPFVMNKLSALAYSFPFYRIILQKHIRHFLKHNDIDALHVHDIRVADAVFRENKKYSYPLTLDMHENRPEIMKLYGFVRSFPGNKLIDLDEWKRKEEEFTRLADRVVVVTEEAKAELVERIKLDPSKITSLPNTPLQSFYTDYTIDKDIIERYKDGFNLIYIGETGLRRGILNAIEAVALLKPEIPNIKLILVGKSNVDDYLKMRADHMDVKDNVDYQGWQDPSTFASYISASHIGLSPLRRNKHHDTTYANKIFQYMAFGKAIIVSDCPAQAKIVEENNVGLVHKSNNGIDLSEMILKLYKDRDLLHKCQVNASELIKNKYNWEMTGNALTELYKDIFND